MYFDYSKAMITPWGRADYVKHIQKGVLWVGTPSHGGLLVSKSVAKKSLTPQARMCGWRWGDYYAYEEDCEYAVAFLERPEWAVQADSLTGSKTDLDGLKAIVERWSPRYFTITQEEIDEFLQGENPQVGQKLILRNSSIPYVVVETVRPLVGVYQGKRYRIPSVCL